MEQLALVTGGFDVVRSADPMCTNSIDFDPAVVVVAVDMVSAVTGECVIVLVCVVVIIVFIGVMLGGGWCCRGAR